jgi:hypothetical protein
MADVQGTQSTVTLRSGRPTDTTACGRICYEAFEAIARQHNFAPDFPSVEVATGLITMLLSHPGFFSVVAEAGGEVVGSNFLDERSPIAGVGPITVDPQGAKSEDWSPPDAGRSRPSYRAKLSRGPTAAVLIPQSFSRALRDTGFSAPGIHRLHARPCHWGFTGRLSSKASR